MEEYSWLLHDRKSCTSRSHLRDAHKSEAVAGGAWAGRETRADAGSGTGAGLQGTELWMDHIKIKRNSIHPQRVKGRERA